MVQHVLASVPAIVPPTASKLLLVGGIPRDGFVAHGHAKAMKATWSTLLAALDEASEIVAIGYSLPGTDAASIEVLKRFGASATTTHTKRVLLVEPNPAVADRYRSVLGVRAEVVCSDFGTFDPANPPPRFPSCRGPERWPRERAERTAPRRLGWAAAWPGRARTDRRERRVRLDRHGRDVVGALDLKLGTSRQGGVNRRVQRPAARVGFVAQRLAAERCPPDREAVSRRCIHTRRQALPSLCSRTDAACSRALRARRYGYGIWRAAPSYAASGFYPRAREAQMGAAADQPALYATPAKRKIRRTTSTGSSNGGSPQTGAPAAMRVYRLAALTVGAALIGTRNLNFLSRRARVGQIL